MESFDKVWFTSDPHWDHFAITMYCNRPFAVHPSTGLLVRPSEILAYDSCAFDWKDRETWPQISVDDMNRTLIHNWNCVVGERDLVYVLGDLMMGRRQKEMARRLLGQLNGTICLVRGNHDKRADFFYEAGWEHVCDHAVYTPDQGKTMCLLRHYPYYGLPDPRGRVKERPADEPPEDQFDWVFHGHVHTAWKRRGNRVNVGVDVHDFTPVSFEQLMNCPDNS